MLGLDRCYRGCIEDIWGVYGGYRGYIGVFRLLRCAACLGKIWDISEAPD